MEADDQRAAEGLIRQRMGPIFRLHEVGALLTSGGVCFREQMATSPMDFWVSRCLTSSRRKTEIVQSQW